MRESTTQAKPKPAPQPPRARSAPDLRPLPLPEPYDKNAPHPSRNQRHQEDWTWNAWRDYIFDAASRKWNKPSIKRVLKLRDQYPANRKMDFTKTSELWTKRGWIYGLFHFASGRWYVGQTSREYWVRAEEHWHSRKRLTDVLHNALANEISPFSVVVFPLEKIADNLFQKQNTRDYLKAFPTLCHGAGALLDWSSQLPLAPGIQLIIPWEARISLGTTLLALSCARSNGAK